MRPSGFHSVTPVICWTALPNTACVRVRTFHALLANEPPGRRDSNEHPSEETIVQGSTADITRVAESYSQQPISDVAARIGSSCGCPSYASVHSDPGVTSLPCADGKVSAHLANFSQWRAGSRAPLRSTKAG